MMETRATQIVRINDQSSGQQASSKPVLLVKSITPALGSVISTPEVSHGNTLVLKFLPAQSVCTATDRTLPGVDEVTVVNSSTAGLEKGTDVTFTNSSSDLEKKHNIYIAPKVTTSKTQSIAGKGTFVSKNNVVESNNCQKASKQEIKRVTDSSTVKKSPIIMFKWGSTDKPFRCQICDLSFTEGNLLRIHMEKHANLKTEPSKPFPCNLCTKSFQSSRSLERHQFVHSGQSQKRCKYCYKVFANKENLDKHMQMHASVNKSLVCQFCNETCPSRSVLEAHTTFHTGQKQFKCQTCEKSFNRKDTLERHSMTHDLGKRNKHQCVECYKTFSFLFALKRHVRSVHGEEPDGKECEICGKFIKNRENVARHMQIHDGKRPYACPECGQKFTQKQHMMDHLVVHTNTLPFGCKICGLSFCYKRSLNRHNKKHFKYDSNRQKFQCAKCSNLFSNEADMMNHVERFHCKMYQCLMCKHPFSDEGTLLKHLLQTHNISVETCSRKKVDLAHKSTGTDSVDMETMEVSSVETELPNNAENASTVIEDKTIELKDTVDSKNEAGEHFKATENGGSIVCIPKENESHIISNGQEVVYILYDNGQQIVLNKEHSPSGETITESDTQGEITAYALDGTQVFHVGEIGTETEEMQQEFEEQSEIVELSGEGGDESHVYQTDQTDGKEIMSKYMVTQVANVEDGCSYGTRDAKFVTDRTELIQSLIDYAEKIQEEELSMTNSETKI